MKQGIDMVMLHTQKKSTYAGLVILYLVMSGCTNHAIYNTSMAILSRIPHTKPKPKCTNIYCQAIKKKLTQRDLLKLNTALNTIKADRVSRWRNSDSGLYYKIKPGIEFGGVSDKLCRHYSLKIHTEDNKRQLSVTACRDESGQWNSIMTDADLRGVDLALRKGWNQKWSWYNNDSGIHYRAIPTGTYHNSRNILCRTFVLVKWENDQSSQIKLSACLGAKGRWPIN